MRAVAGALLIVAASICFCAAHVLRGTAGGYTETWQAFVAAAGLGLAGLVLLFVGLAKDRP